MVKNGSRSWWKGEDWWTIWLGAIIIAAAGFGLVKYIPKLPKWQGSLSAALPADMILPLIGLGIGILALTGVLYVHGGRKYGDILLLSVCLLAGGCGVYHW